MSAISIYGTNGMDYKFAGKIIGSCNFRLSSLAAIQCPALSQQLRACSTMNCSIHSSAPEQRLIGSINNSIHIILLCYIA